MGREEPPSQRSGVKNAKQRALDAAEDLGHRFGKNNWYKVVGGVRGRCLNPGCQGSMFLRHTNHSDADKNPTVLKHRCPYILRNLRIGGRQAPRRKESQ